jgi:hypothetical protein
MEMPWFFLVLDPYLIWFYRLTGHPGWNFFLGTSALAVHCLALGEGTGLLVRRLVGRHLEDISREARRYHDLSLEALKSGDRAAYEAANKLANEAFNKSFYQQIAMSGAFLWPVPVALAWMQYRFRELAFPIPGLGLSLGFSGIFLLCYLAVYFLWKRLRLRLFPHRRELSLPQGGPPAL